MGPQLRKRPEINNKKSRDLSGIGILSAAGPDYSEIGFDHTAIFNQSGGTYIISGGGLIVGASSGATGTYILSGTGSLTDSGNEYLGYNGTGIFNQTGGTNSITGGGELDIAPYSISAGAYVLTGGTLAVNGNAYVGGSRTSSGGTGTLTVSGTGQMTVTGAFTIFNGNVSASNEYVGGGAASNASIVVGPAGTDNVNQSGGANSIGTSLYVGDNSGSTGTYVLSGSSSLSVAASEYIGVSGTGIFNQSGGTNTLTNPASGLDLYLGDLPGSTGTYVLSSTGSLSVARTEYVGYEGAGLFNQTGGTNALTGGFNFVIGYKAGSTGVYNVSGGSTNCTGGILVGGSTSGSGGSGILSVGGTGLLNIADGITAYDTPGSAIDLTGGTINTASLDFNGNPSLFHWTGGTLGLTSGVIFDPGAAATSTSAAFGSSLTLGANQTLNVTGNETLGGTSSFSLTLNPGSNDIVSGTTTVNAGSTLNLAGGTLTTAQLIYNGPLTITGNTRLGQFNGASSLTIGTTGSPAFLQLSPGSGSSTTGALTVNSGSTLDVTNNALTINYGIGTDPISVIQSYLANGEIASSFVASLNASQSQLIYSIGYADGSDGITGVPSGEIEILPTLAGDAKLQGNVVFGDFQLLSQYFGQPNTTWDEGNFTYGSSTNFGDFQLLSQDFGANASSLTAGEIASLNSFAEVFGDQLISNPSGIGFALVQVPEPASAGLLAFATAGLFARRRRRDVFRRVNAKDRSIAESR
jgi:hypothetical protein